MTHAQDWDIEKYKCEHEPKHHWQLKKKFMEFHKDRFPENELVSLHPMFSDNIHNDRIRRRKSRLKEAATWK